VIAGICSLLSVSAWWATRCASRRWLYRNVGDHEHSTKRQKILFAALALIIVLTSFSGWSWLQGLQDYMKDNNLSQAAIAAFSRADHEPFRST
jgi:hypothetical protein